MFARLMVPVVTAASLPLVATVHAAEEEKDTPLQTGKSYKIHELPIYGDPPKPEFEYIPEEITPYRESVSTARKATWEYLDSIQETTNKAKSGYATTKGYFSDGLKYIQEDSGVVPRAGIITIAGLGGIVAGYKGGAIRKTLFAGAAMLTAASVCYPNQAVDISRSSFDYARKEAAQLWNKQDLQQKTETPDSTKGSHISSEVPKTEDKSTVKKGGSQLKVNETKEDHGMSKAEDKDLYTTRS